jgi:uncharacterized protein
LHTSDIAGVFATHSALVSAGSNWFNVAGKYFGLNHGPRRDSPSHCRRKPSLVARPSLITRRSILQREAQGAASVTLLDPVSFYVLCAGTFAGAVVSGLAGFAFSAVVGALWLHMLPPAEAVPLMMACSLVTQAVSLIALRGTVRWRGSPTLIGGGVLGLLPAVWLLGKIDPATFRLGFGAFLVAYAAWMLLRPSLRLAREAPGPLRQALVGLGGGLIGGLTAMPGALPTIWCDLRGLPKADQRGLVQPYITAMQVSALVLMFGQNGIPNHMLLNVTISLPTLVIGAAIGVSLFNRISTGTFRCVVLTLLLAGGLTFLL